MLNVIVADDFKDIHHGIESTLKRHYPDVSMQSFYTIDDLLAYFAFEAWDGDILFLDNDFGRGQQGIDVLPEIRKHAPVLPISLLTAEDNLTRIKRIREYDAIYFQKPITDTKLIMHLEEMLDRQKMVNNTINKILEQIPNIRRLVLKGEKRQATNEETLEFEEKIWAAMVQLKEEMIHEEKDTIAFFQRELKSNFPKIAEAPLGYLVTAEYLYHKNKKVPIDYSPIILGYGKTLEYYLRKYIASKVANHSQYCMGDIINGWKNSFHQNHVESMRTINRLRNACAHADEILKVDSSHVEKIRNHLFKGQLLRYTMDLA